MASSGNGTDKSAVTKLVHIENFQTATEDSPVRLTDVAKLVKAAEGMYFDCLTYLGSNICALTICPHLQNMLESSLGRHADCTDCTVQAESPVPEADQFSREVLSCIVCTNYATMILTFQSLALQQTPIFQT
jgi:hypothetical protein